jgi:2EXR family
MDTTETLIASFGNLSLPTSSSAPLPHQPQFAFFPDLPTELRRKIYSFALPQRGPRAILSLDAKILISDSRFGLYLLFTHPAPEARSFAPPAPKLLTAHTRALALLSLCQESRAYYLEKFSICLPLGPGVYGRLHISSAETLFIKNFSELMDKHGFKSAISNDYRLQDWVPKTEKMVMDIGCFALGSSAWEDDETVAWEKVGRFLVQCKGLKEVKVAMWDGFGEECKDEEVRSQMMGSMRGLVRSVEVGLERYREAVDGMYVVPEFEIVATLETD